MVIHGKGHFPPPPYTPQWKKGPELVLAAAITLAVSPHLSGPQFFHLLMEAITFPLWIVGKQETECVESLGKTLALSIKHVWCFSFFYFTW